MKKINKPKVKDFSQIFVISNKKSRTFGKETNTGYANASPRIRKSLENLKLAFRFCFFAISTSGSPPENPLSAWPGVNARVCDSDGPGRVADCHLHVPLVCCR